MHIKIKCGHSAHQSTVKTGRKLETRGDRLTKGSIRHKLKAKQRIECDEGIVEGIGVKPSSDEESVRDVVRKEPIICLWLRTLLIGGNIVTKRMAREESGSVA